MNPETGISKPVCRLTGIDGNVYSVIGAVDKTLRRAGLKDRADEFKRRAFEQKSYDDVLMLVHEYVEAE